MTRAEIEARWGMPLLELLQQLAAQGFNRVQAARVVSTRPRNLPAQPWAQFSRYPKGVFQLGNLAVKRCSCCWTTRPLTDFRDHGRRKDGIDSFCKPCRWARRHATEEKRHVEKR